MWYICVKLMYFDKITGITTPIDNTDCFPAIQQMSAWIKTRCINLEGRHCVLWKHILLLSSQWDVFGLSRYKLCSSNNMFSSYTYINTLSFHKRNTITSMQQTDVPGHNMSLSFSVPGMKILYEYRGNVSFYSLPLIARNSALKYIRNTNIALYLICAVWVSYSVYTIRVTVIPMASFHMFVVVGPVCKFSTTFSTAIGPLTSVLPAMNLVHMG